jgi:glycosyltransferase involved in cell wall biosynthesis
MDRLRIVHLVDDTTAGGVMRVLDHLMTAPELSRDATHSLEIVDRRAVFSKRIKADLIVSHLAMSGRVLPSILSLRARHPRAKLIHVEHSYTEGFVAVNVTHTRRFALLLRTAYRVFDNVVAVSHAQGEWLERSGAVRISALTVIQSCVDLSAFRAIAPPTTPIRVFGAIGRLNKQKGFDTLIQAFRMTDRSDLSLYIYGEGAEETSLRALAGDDARIHFKGFTDDPVAAMAAVDAVAMPSVWEAYGLVAIEAMAAGRRLMVNPVDGLMDHVPYGALAVCNGSVSAWKHAILDLAEARSETDACSICPAVQLEDNFAAEWYKLMQKSALEPVRIGVF